MEGVKESLEQLIAKLVDLEIEVDIVLPLGDLEATEDEVIERVLSDIRQHVESKPQDEPQSGDLPVGLPI